MSVTLARRHALDAATRVEREEARARGAARGVVSAVYRRPPWELTGAQLALVAGEGLVGQSKVNAWRGRVGGRGVAAADADAPSYINVGVNVLAAPGFALGNVMSSLVVPATTPGATVWRDGATPIMYAPSGLFVAVAFGTVGAGPFGPTGSMPTQGATLLHVPNVLTVGTWNGSRLYARVVQSDGSAVLLGGAELEAGFDEGERVYVVELALQAGVLSLRIDGAEYSAPFGTLFASGGPGIQLGGGVGGAGWALPISMVAIGNIVPSARELLEFRAWCLERLGDAPCWVAAPEPATTVVP